MKNVLRSCCAVLMCVAGANAAVLDDPTDLDLSGIVKAINFGDTTDQVVGGVKFRAVPANSTLDEVKNVAQGMVSVRQNGQTLPELGDGEQTASKDRVCKSPAEELRRDPFHQTTRIALQSHGRPVLRHDRAAGRQAPLPPLMPKFSANGLDFVVIQQIRQRSQLKNRRLILAGFRERRYTPQQASLPSRKGFCSTFSSTRPAFLIAQNRLS